LFIGIGSEGWTAIFTGVLTAATIGLLWATYRASRQTGQALEAVERAYLLIDLEEAFTVISPALIDCAIHVQNGGKTPGVVFECYGDFVKEGTLPEKATYGRSDLVLQVQTTIPTNYTLPVGSIQINNPRAIEIVFGYVKYRDIFKIVRMTTFAAKIDGQHRTIERVGGDEWNQSN
jgi:hypothetical protein